jgi:hypothetical protein
MDMNLNKIEVMLDTLEHKITTMASDNFIGNQYGRKTWISFFEDLDTYKSILAKYHDRPRFQFLSHGSNDTQLRVATLTNSNPFAIVTHSKKDTFNVYRNKPQNLIPVGQDLSSFEVFSILEGM